MQSKFENGKLILVKERASESATVSVINNNGEAVTDEFRITLLGDVGVATQIDPAKALKWKAERGSGDKYSITVKSGEGVTQNHTWKTPVLPTQPVPPTPKPPTPPAPLSPPTPPADDESAKDGGSKPADQKAVNRLQEIIADQLNALGQLEQAGKFPEWMNAARLNNMGAAAEEVFKQLPGDEKVKLMAGRILTNGKLIREALANASKVAPAKRKPEPKPADSPAQGQEDQEDQEDQGDHIPIESRVKKLEGRADQTDKDLHAVGSLAAKGIDELTQAIAGLRPATDPKSGASGNGGKASASSPGPYHAGHGLKGLLIGLGAMFVLGLIVLCTHLMSKNPSAGIMPAMVPVIMITNNAVAPVVSPPVPTMGLIETPAKVIPRPNTVSLDKEGAKEAGRAVVSGGNIINSYNTTTYNTVVTNVAVIPAPPAPPVVDSPQPMVGNTGPTGLVGSSGETPESHHLEGFPVDPACFSLWFNRSIGMMDRSPYGYYPK